MKADLQSLYHAALFQAFGKDIEVLDAQIQTGGCINTAAKLITPEGPLLLKWNTHASQDFGWEERGLSLLASSGSVHCPHVYYQGRFEDTSFILMEYLAHAYPSSANFADLGHQIARLHQHSASFFGLAYDNVIGSLAQKNEPKKDWLSFFIENRLHVQAGLALYKGLVDQAWLERFKSLYPLLTDFFPYEPPALLHGDLWSGNILFSTDARFYLIDPAVYYGHREMELAFTKLFGGFEASFYQAYEDTFPLAPEFDNRIDVYNLYPLLVHANLFGASYLRGVEKVLERFGI